MKKNIYNETRKLKYSTVQGPVLSSYWIIRGSQKVSQQFFFNELNYSEKLHYYCFFMILYIQGRKKVEQQGIIG